MNENLEVIMRLIENEDRYHQKKETMAWTIGAFYFVFLERFLHGCGRILFVQNSTLLWVLDWVLSTSVLLYLHRYNLDQGGILLIEVIDITEFSVQ